MLEKLTEYLNHCKIVLCANPDTLEALQPHVTVEAEYGDRVVRGSALTLAHHGPRSHNPAPCIAEVSATASHVVGEMDEPIIGLSHVDLDTLGGLIRLAEGSEYEFGCKAFWEVAAFVDTHGAHKLSEVSAEGSKEASQMYAWWAWNEKNRLFPNRNGEPTDAGEWVRQALNALDSIFGMCPMMLSLGDEMRLAEEKLNAESFVECFYGVVVRFSTGFVNHLYRLPDGSFADVVVSFNMLKGNVTVSRESDDVSLNCRDLVQFLWGEEAGGHDGIAGSPRDRRLLLKDVVEAAALARERLNG